MNRGRRLAAELALLVLLYVMSLPDPDLFTKTISGLVLVTLPIVFTVASILVWASRQAPEIETLRERADDAATSALIQLALFLVAFGPAFFAWLGWSAPPNAVLVLLSWVAVLNAVPSVGWLGTWRNIWLPIIRRRRALPANADDDPPAGQGRKPDERVAV